MLPAPAPRRVPRAGLPSTPTTAAAADAPAAPTPVGKSRDRVAEAQDLKNARRVLAKLQTRYRYLDGITLRVDPTPQDRQAVAYYTDGEIVISPDHVATIDKILAHEVWHVIDWRDNGQLDWGEDLPPSNAADYRLK